MAPRLPLGLAMRRALVQVGVMGLAVGSGCLGTLGDVEPSSATPGPVAMRRLTRAEYKTTVKDLLGEDLQVPTDLEVDTPLHGYTSVGASELTISPRGAEQYEA